MPCDVIRIDELDTNIEVFTGEIDADDIRAMKVEETERGWISSRVRTLVDLRGLTAPLRPGDVRGYVEWSRQSNQAQRGARVALVASDQVVTALALLFENGMGDQRAIRVFSTVESALQWLELPVGEVRAHWSFDD